MKRKLGTIAVVAVAVLSLPAALGFVGWVRIEQRHEACLRDRRQYDTLHRIIERTGQPSPTGSALDRLVLPADTPAWFRAVIVQLNSRPDKATTEANLRPYYVILGERPKC